jgi:hypothetical protein
MSNLHEQSLSLYRDYSRGVLTFAQFKYKINALIAESRKHVCTPVRTMHGEIWCMYCLEVLKEVA